MSERPGEVDPRCKFAPRQRRAPLRRVTQLAPRARLRLEHSNRTVAGAISIPDPSRACVCEREPSVRAYNHARSLQRHLSRNETHCIPRACRSKTRGPHRSRVAPARGNDLRFALRKLCSVVLQIRAMDETDRVSKARIFRGQDFELR